MLRLAPLDDLGDAAVGVEALLEDVPHALEVLPLVALHVEVGPEQEGGAEVPAVALQEVEEQPGEYRKQEVHTQKCTSASPFARYNQAAGSEPS